MIGDDAVEEALEHAKQARSAYQEALRAGSDPARIMGLRAEVFEAEGEVDRAKRERG